MRKLININDICSCGKSKKMPMCDGTCLKQPKKGK